MACEPAKNKKQMFNCHLLQKIKMFSKLFELDEQLSFEWKIAPKTINHFAQTRKKTVMPNRIDLYLNVSARNECSHSKWNWKHDLGKFMGNQEHTRTSRLATVGCSCAHNAESELNVSSETIAVIRNAACTCGCLWDECCRFQMFNA